MRIHSSTRYMALAALAGALACASNKARTEDTTQPNQAGAARDTTTVGRDTLNGQAENPPGYRGMERDTTIAPEQQQTPTDTFLQRQGQGAPQDTSGYSGMERVDTTGQRVDTTGQADTSGYNVNPADTSGYNANPSGQADTSGYNANPGAAQDTTQMQGDTTGTSSRDTSGAYAPGAGSLDSTGMSRTGDTTGYKQSQQSQDTTSR